MLAHTRRSLAVGPAGSLALAGSKISSVAAARRALSASAASPAATSKGPLQRLLDWFTFRPEESYPGFTFPVSTYRYPSPGSPAKHEPVRVPQLEDPETLFNTQYYTRDTRRNKAPIVLYASKGHDALPFPKASEVQLLGSPGRVNPTVAMYDPTGTRTTMTTTWKAMNALIEKHRPNHLPQPWWAQTPAHVPALAKVNAATVSNAREAERVRAAQKKLEELKAMRPTSSAAGRYFKPVFVGKDQREAEW